MQDALNVLQTSAAADNDPAVTNSTGVDLGVGGTLRSVLWARIIYSALTGGGSRTVTFSIEHSADNSTWYACSSGAADVITATATAQAGEVNIPFVTDKRYVRLVTTWSATTGGTDTVTRVAYITTTAP